MLNLARISELVQPCEGPGGIWKESMTPTSPVSGGCRLKLDNKPTCTYGVIIKAYHAPWLYYLFFFFVVANITANFSVDISR